MTVAASPSRGPARSGLNPLDWAGCLALALAGVYVVMLIGGAGQGEWLLRPDGAPKPMDFTSLWGAGRLAATGHAASAYDWPRLQAELARATGHPFPDKLPFFYPPVFLLVLAPLGTASFLAAAVIWLSLSLAAYGLAAWAILPRLPALAIALAAPGVLWSVCVAQNGLLTAAVLGSGLALLPRRPLAAGAVLGLLAYKPHYAVLVPLALAAGGRWRTLAAMGLSAVALVGISALVFGPDTSIAFLKASAEANRSLTGAAGAPWGGWSKLQSVYGVARAMGAPGWAAGSLHAGLALAAAAGLALLWRSRATDALKAAALPVAALLFTPYAFIYDTALLGVATLFLLREGLERGLPAQHTAILAVAALLPLAFAVSPLSTTPLACLLLGLIVALRARSGSAPYRFNPVATR